MTTTMNTDENLTLKNTTLSSPMLMSVSQTSTLLPFHAFEIEPSNQTNNKMHSEEPEVDNVNDSDITSTDISSNRNNNESMIQDDSNGEGIEQDSTLSLINEENDSEEFESAIVDVATTEEIESVQSELESKSQQQQGEGELGIIHNEDEIQSEKNITEMDDMIDEEETDEDMKQEIFDSDNTTSVTSLEAQTTKEMTEEVK
ncbi:hypothetical protein LOAG_10510 [Loa loa]|uniref:Uncharacterized protein n=1 Tax=Loa loa TaxID=7209 RepID=A0A1S0TPM5_LOALO|nr:hypothetical protein LOAG_10510 [Loa loa]EFO17989.2 hypothetical protein LOAG_10510 [Loa loa]